MAKKSKYKFAAPDVKAVNKKSKKHKHLFNQAMHYAQYEMTDAQLCKKMLAYAKMKKLDHKLLSVLKDRDLALAGRYAFIVVDGGELPEEIEVSFERRVEELLEKAKTIKKEQKVNVKAVKKATGPVLTVQDRMRIQAENVAQEFDGWVDDLMFGKVKSVTKQMDPTSRMHAANFKAGQARYIKSFYEPELAEIKEVVAGTDPDVKEGYSNIAKSSALRVQKLLERIVTAADMIATVAKAQRKTRKKKMPTVEKQIAKLKYCEQSKEYGVASVSPTGIIGAKEVWVFNTKYRKLGKYVAKDAGGLGVKGTTIQDFNESASVQKTLRKPKEQLRDFMSGGKVKVRKFLSEIRAVDTKMTGRLNENVVILRVFK